MEIPHLVDRYIDRIIPGLDLEVVRFRGLHGDGEEDRPAAGGADTKIAFPLIDILEHLIGDLDIVGGWGAGKIGMHVSIKLGYLR